MSGEKRNVSGNAFASALRAWQPAVGIRECHRIFCCTSYCLRALSVCVLLLRTGTVSAAVTCPSGDSLLVVLPLCAGADGVAAAAVPGLSGGKSSRGSGNVSQSCAPSVHPLSPWVSASIGWLLAAGETSLRSAVAGDLSGDFPNL